MAKKTTSFRLEPKVLRKLKLLSFDYDKPIGDILEGLVKFSESGDLINNQEFQKRFNALLDMAFVNSGKKTEKE